jgi:hypothetical protein
MRSSVLFFLLCWTLAVTAAHAGLPADSLMRLPGFASFRSDIAPRLEDVLPAEIVAQKAAFGGNVVASVETLESGWRLRLLRYQEYNYTLSAWVDFERDTTLYDVNDRISLVSARRVVDSVWQNYYKFVYSYDAAGNLMEFLSQSWYDNAWLNYVRYVSTFDAQGHQLTFTHIKWFSGDWQNVRRYSWVYDDVGNPTEYVFELWTGSDWLGYTRSLYGYDLFSRRINTVQQVWADTAWVNTQHDSTAYDPAGLPGTLITQMWEPQGKVWLNYVSTVLNYNPHGKETIRLNRVWFEPYWLDTNRTVSVYEPQGHLRTVTKQIRVNAQWADSAHDVYDYDPAWNLTSFVTQTWSGSVWLNVLLYTYTYDLRSRRLSELSQRWGTSDWLNKSYIEKTYDEVGNVLTETRYLWSGYYWLNTARYIYSYGGPKQVYDVFGKWNIVSVPLSASDYTKTTVFPTAVSDAFVFDQGYSAAETLAHGRAYWMKFATNQSIIFEGETRLHDTIDVVAGWNMVGSLSASVLVANITSIPESLGTGEFYGYNAGYKASPTLDPPQGYWVKVSQPGKLVLDGTIIDPPANRIRVRDTGEKPPPPPDAVTEAEDGVPAEYRLGQNYPNPFNPSTTISYALREDTEVDLRVYDLFGRVVAVLASGHQHAGDHAVIWDAAGVSSGVYFYKLAAGEFTKSEKMVLLR